MIARLSQLSVLRAIDAAMAPDSSLEHIGSPPPPPSGLAWSTIAGAGELACGCPARGM